jgi:hypothetical protein
VVTVVGLEAGYNCLLVNPTYCNESDCAYACAGELVRAFDLNSRHMELFEHCCETVKMHDSSLLGVDPYLYQGKW